jgi:hypothetical protein
LSKVWRPLIRAETSALAKFSQLISTHFAVKICESVAYKLKNKESRGAALFFGLIKTKNL